MALEPTDVCALRPEPITYKDRAEVLAAERHARHLRACVRRLEEPGWEHRLQPLAAHMASKALVRSRSEHGAPLRRLDLAVLRQALSDLLVADDEDGMLIYQLVVEGTEPARVPAERGVSRAALVEELRDAVDALAAQYEDEANQALDGLAEPDAMQNVRVYDRYRGTPAERRCATFHAPTHGSATRCVRRWRCGSVSRRPSASGTS
jgi:hypothetical protein